jgi:hypothetical protein
MRRDRKSVGFSARTGVFLDDQSITLDRSVSGILYHRAAAGHWKHERFSRLVIRYVKYRGLGGDPEFLSSQDYLHEKGRGLFMSRFTLDPREWYAMELLSSEFGTEVRRYSPIRVDGLAPKGSGSRRFDLSFFHAAYPEGVQNKVYTIKTVQRCDHFLFGRVADTNRLVLFLELSDKWLKQHFDDQALNYLRTLQRS